MIPDRIELQKITCQDLTKNISKDVIQELPGIYITSPPTSRCVQNGKQIWWCQGNLVDEEQGDAAPFLAQRLSAIARRLLQEEVLLPAKTGHVMEGGSSDEPSRRILRCHPFRHTRQVFFVYWQNHFVQHKRLAAPARAMDKDATDHILQQL
jgi:hypothetical protein